MANLDFIPSTKLRAGINYDIKYRMGREEEVGEKKGVGNLLLLGRWWIPTGS